MHQHNPIFLNILKWLMALIAMFPVHLKAQDNFESEVLKLEADVQTLNWYLNPDNPSSRSQYRLAKALKTALINPAQAQAYFDLALKDTDLDQRTKALIHLEWGRVLAKNTYHNQAIKHFSETIKLAEDPQMRGHALESYAISLRSSKSIGKLPTYLEAYEVKYTKKKKLDPAAQEAIYNIAYALVRNGDQRARILLEKLVAKSMVGRRALYLLGALEIQSKNYPKAQAYFKKATSFILPALNYPDLRKRDREVLELSWLALGRVCFETKDFFNGIDAYQQIPNTSSHYTDAVYEMGWLALDHGEHSTALAALEPLARAKPNDVLGWQALLLKGYIMLQKNNYQRAKKYYTGLVEYFAQRSKQLEQELEALKPYTRLLDDSALRQRLLKAPFLQKIYQQPKLVEAQNLSLPINDFKKLDIDIEEQYLYIDTALSHEKPTGATSSLNKDIEHITLKKTEINDALKRNKLTVKQEKRLQKLTSTLGQLYKSILGEQERIKKTFAKERTHLDSLKQERQALEEKYQHSLEQYRNTLLNEAVINLTKRIKAMRIEGEAGILQSIWRYKEDQYNVIMGLVDARRTELAILEERYQETLEYLGRGPF